MMGPKKLNEYVRAPRFQPFRITLVSGESYDIRHPEMVAVGKRSSIVFEWDRRTESFDRAIMISNTLIERLEALETVEAN